MKKSTYFVHFIFSSIIFFSILILHDKVNAAASIGSFQVNGSTSIIASFDTTLTFTGTQSGSVGCDLNVFDENNVYVGPYKRAGGAGVGVNGDGTLNFSSQNGTFNSSAYADRAAGGYNFELVCDDGGGVNIQRRRVYVDLSRPISATHSCSPQSNVTLNWTAIQSPSYYNIMRNGWTVPWQVYTNTAVDSGTFDGPVNSNTTYTYTITPIRNGSAISTAIQTVTLTTGNCAPPPSPATLNVNNSQCPDASWSISPGGYFGTSQTVSPGTYTLTTSIPPNYTNFQVTNSDGGTNSMNLASGQTKTFYISCTPPPPPPNAPTVNLTINGGSSATINAGQSATLAWSSAYANSCTATGSWSGTKSTSGSQSTGTLSTGGTYTYYLYCSGTGGNSPTASVTLTVNSTSCTWGTWSTCSVSCGGGTQTRTSSCGGTESQSCNTQSCTTTLPACTVDSFPAQSEYNGWVYPTWTTSNSNNVVLSGGQFGSGVPVEPDGQRGISIDQNTLLTITANAGATCSPSASRSAWMYAEGTPPPPPPGSACNITYFPDDGEDGNGWVYPQWQTNATNLTLSGGPFNNTSVGAPNGSTAMQISQNTWLTLSGNGGQCTDTAIFYAAAPPPPPPNFTATAGACGTNRINLSWGISAGAGGYKLYRNGIQIMDAPVNSYSDTGLTPGATYSYTVIGTSPNGNTAPSYTSATAPLNCTPPASPTGFTAVPSSCGNYWINLSWNASSGATSYQVYRSGTLVYNGANLAFSDTGVSPGASYTYTITATGAYGTSGAGSATPSPVTAPSACVLPFNYSLSNSGNVSVTKGGVNQFGQNTVTKTLTAGNPESVNLSASGLPSGVSYVVSNQSCAPTCNSSLTFTVTPSASTGTFPITVTGTPLNRTTSFNLTINPSSAVVVTCSVNPSSGGKIGDIITWAANVSGGSGTGYTYSWSGTNIPTSPAPSTSSYAITYSTIGTKVARVNVTDSLGNSGTCPDISTIITFSPIIEEF